jgi:hypothetical protein
MSDHVPTVAVVEAKGAWLSTAEVRAEFGFAQQNLYNWRKSCPPLGRPLRVEKGNNGFLSWRPDLEQIKKARDTPAVREFTDEAGEVWVTRHIAAVAPLRFGFTRLRRLASKPCRLLDADHPRPLRMREQYVYRRRQGFQRVLYFNRSDLATIRNNLDLGHVVSKTHGPGLTLGEVRKEFGVGQDYLESQGISSWREVRIIGRKVPAGTTAPITPRRLCTLRVYSAAKIKEALQRQPLLPSAADVADRQAEAEKFLRKRLAVGPERARVIVQEARQAGIADARLRAARLALGVKRYLAEVPKRGRLWHWCLPRDFEDMRERARCFVEREVKDSPANAIELRRKAAGIGISEAMLRWAKHALGLRSERWNWESPYWWCRTGQVPPAPAEKATAIGDAGPQTSAASKRTRATEEAAKERAAIPDVVHKIDVNNPDQVAESIASRLKPHFDRIVGVKQNDQAEEEPLTPSKQKMKFCYDQYLDFTKKLDTVVKEAKALFGDKAPKSRADVVTYASRWAKLIGKELPRRN